MDNDSSDDMEKLVTIEEVAKQLRMPVSLARYSIDLGCPTIDGKLSAGILTEWMSTNYNRIRQLAGLPLLPSHEKLSQPQRSRTVMKNLLLTYIDFVQTRSSLPEIIEIRLIA